MPRIASTEKATKIRPDEHWDSVVGAARISKVKARQQRLQVVCGLQACAETQELQAKKV